METCHSQEQFNVTSNDAMVVAIMTLQAFAVMWINTFIVTVLCMACIKKKTLNSNEKILLLLGFSRFWYLFFSWLYSFLSRIYPHSLYVHPTLQLVVSCQGFFNCFNLWVSACLCVFYCIKIANFGNSFFIYLKVKIDRIVPWLLFGAVLLSLVIAIVAYDIADKVHCNNRNSTGRGSFWITNIKMDKHFFPSFFLTGFEYAVSFMAVIFAALLLLFSLWKHKCNMQTNSMKDLSMDAHIKAMKSILSFLVMYTINFASLILTMVYTTKKGSPVMFLIVLFQYAFPGVHSLFLIFSNPKLEKALLRILPCVKFRVCMR
ncbi:taste receptor type 2 member 2-like [Pithys albifrons albifrons]|uniref:taste receptor type 2 member 2-like n=1 Tax=Pithys albifrons albifrons TaxID=3385563 RepID=UPI003A5CD968